MKDALYSRFQTMKSSGIFAGEKQESVRVDSVIRSLLPGGGALVISLKRSSSLTKKMVVEIILSKLVQLLEREAIPPVFLFAEEAHLYLRDTYWDDIVTRMRHFGIFTTLITNQPDAINDGIYRQADNIFLFNFTNETDSRHDRQSIYGGWTNDQVDSEDSSKKTLLDSGKSGLRTYQCLSRWAKQSSSQWVKRKSSSAIDWSKKRNC